MNNNSLDALFTGLTGTQTAESTKDDAPSSSKSRQEKKPDLPKDEKKAEERFCTIVSSDLIHKIRIIANRERLQIRDVVNAAFEKAIKSYERKHGTIDDDVKRDAKDLF